MLIKRWVWLLCAIFVAVTATPDCSAVQKRKKLNILFLFADDQRRDTIGALGNPHISTPNLDKLVASGTTFTRAYIQGSMSGAVCLPSRAMLLSGRTLWRVPMNLQGVVTLGEVLRRAGYLTFGTGKWHNGAPSFTRSFEYGNAIMFGGMSNHFDVPLSRPKGGGKYEKYRQKGTHSSEIFADAAVDFLKNQCGKGKNKGKPFFLYVAFTAPHDPRDAPKNFLQQYYKNLPPLPENFKPQHPFDNGQLVLRDENLAPWPRTEKVIRDQLAEYYAIISHMDQQIGRILATLRAIGEYDNTIIVFAADHGLAVGSHGLLGKQNLYEHSMGTPLIFAGPDIPRNEKRDAFAYLYDIYPTLCKMNGVAVPESVEGKSLEGLISGKTKSIRDTIYTNYRHLQRGVRDDQFSLICYPKIRHCQLFDMKNDPYQLKNLAYMPKYAKRVQQLKKQLLAWEAKLGKPGMDLPIDNTDPKFVDLTGHNRQPDRWQPKWIREKYFGK